MNADTTRLARTLAPPPFGRERCSGENDCPCRACDDRVEPRDNERRLLGDMLMGDQQAAEFVALVDVRRIRSPLMRALYLAACILMDGAPLGVADNSIAMRLKRLAVEHHGVDGPDSAVEIMRAIASAGQAPPRETFRLITSRPIPEQPGPR